MEDCLERGAEIADGIPATEYGSYGSVDASGGLAAGRYSFLQSVWTWTFVPAWTSTYRLSCSQMGLPQRAHTAEGAYRFSHHMVIATKPRKPTIETIIVIRPLAATSFIICLSAS